MNKLVILFLFFGYFSQGQATLIPYTKEEGVLLFQNLSQQYVLTYQVDNTQKVVFYAIYSPTRRVSLDGSVEADIWNYAIDVFLSEWKIKYKTKCKYPLTEHE